MLTWKCFVYWFKTLFSGPPLSRSTKLLRVFKRKKNTWSCTVLVNSSYDLELSLNSLIVFINLFIYLFQWASCWSWPIVCQWTLRMVSYCVGLLVMVNYSHDPLLSLNFLIVASWLLLFIYYSNEVHAGADRWFMSIKISSKGLPTDSCLWCYPLRCDKRLFSWMGGIWIILLHCSSSKSLLFNYQDHPSYCNKWNVILTSLKCFWYLV